MSTLLSVVVLGIAPSADGVHGVDRAALVCHVQDLMRFVLAGEPGAMRFAAFHHSVGEARRPSFYSLGSALLKRWLARIALGLNRAQGASDGFIVVGCMVPVRLPAGALAAWYRGGGTVAANRHPAGTAS